MCEIVFENGVRQPADCECYRAVMLAYQSLSQVPDHVAMEAAVRVYRHHHPEDRKLDAALTVGRWVSEGRLQ